MSNLWRPALLVIAHKNVVTHAESWWKSLILSQKTSATIPQRLPMRGSYFAKKQKPNLNLRHSLSYSIGTGMIHLSKTFWGTEPPLINLRETLSQEPPNISQDILPYCVDIICTVSVD